MNYKDITSFIESRKMHYFSLLEKLVNINSYSYNLQGVAAVQNLLIQELGHLSKTIDVYQLPTQKILHDSGTLYQQPLGNLITIRKTQSNTNRLVQLLGHVDTVFPPESTFNKAHWDTTNWDTTSTTTKSSLNEKLVGPGAADMKGGLVVLLAALEAFETLTPTLTSAHNLNWQVVLTPDEEIGSPGSKTLFPHLMQNSHLCLIFEPAFADGALVAARPGSLNITVCLKGVSAHAGRDFEKGVSALHAIAPLLLELPSLMSTCSNQCDAKVTINAGKLVAGSASNIVPDTATLRINIRSTSAAGIELAKNGVKNFLLEILKPPITMEFIEDSYRAPKPFNSSLFEQVQALGKELQIPITLRDSFGVTDGNDISQLGIPTIDSLGVVGSGLHTYDEYADMSQFTQRVLLTTMILLKVSTGEL